MPPLRGARAARANRGQTDVDIMEGLPVRQWRKQPAIINKNHQKDAQADANDQNTIWRELPMPKGSEHYPPWSQALLRAARAGRILQRDSRVNDQDKNGDSDEDGEGELDMSFVANRWTQLPREVEEPEAEYLARRRKGLPTLYGAWATDGAAITLRKCRVKKVDAEGNAYALEVLIPEGTTIDGEVEEEEVLPIQNPPQGTIIEGLGIANAEGVIVAEEHMMVVPPRRRPPIPKRKPKGPGRGRKKKVVIAEGTDGGATAVPATAGQVTDNATVNLDGTTPTGQTDAASHADGDDGSDDDDEDGEEGDDSDAEDASRSVSPMKPSSKPENTLKTDTSAPLLDVPVLHVTQVEPETINSPSNVIAEDVPATEALPAKDEGPTLVVDNKDQDVLMGDVPTISEQTAVAEEEVRDIPPESVEIAEPVVDATAEVKAKLPEDHNPLDGLAAPETLPKEEESDQKASPTAEDHDSKDMPMKSKENTPTPAEEPSAEVPIVADKAVEDKDSDAPKA